MDEEYEWRPVGSVVEWADGAGRLVHIGARRLGVYRLADQWYAIKDVCPHMGVSLVGGSTAPGSIREPVVSCPAHGWLFDLKTGAHLGARPCRVASYPVRISKGMVEVGI